MENILVTKSPTDGHLEVKVIDFSMAVVGEKLICGTRGKPSYRAPEMAVAPLYAPFLADCFGMGVILFSAAARTSPWMSTIKGRCKCFDYVTRSSSSAFLPNYFLVSSSKHLTPGIC